MMIWMRIVDEGLQIHREEVTYQTGNGLLFPLCIFGNCFVIYVNIVMVRKAGHVSRPLKRIKRRKKQQKKRYQNPPSLTRLIIYETKKY